MLKLLSAVASLWPLNRPLSEWLVAWYDNGVAMRKYHNMIVLWHLALKRANF